MKKIRLRSELIYLFAIVLLAFAVAMATAADYGVSMIVAPALILSLKTGLTFGQCEYIVQGFLFILFCILMKKVRLVYFSAFLTGLIYGAVLDLWRLVIPQFNPAVTAPGSMGTPVRIVYFALSMVLCSLAIALFFRVYLYPQVVDFFVKGVAGQYGIDRTKFKRCYDAVFLLVSAVMTLVLFREFRGIGIGTIVVTVFNGMIIGVFDRFLGKHFEFTPIFPKLASYFEPEEGEAK